MPDKIKSNKEIKEISEKLHKQGKKIVTTNGSFDLFHIGHLRTLEFSKKQGDVLIVCINSDSSIHKYKSEKRPIINEKYRSEIVAAICIVDYVTLFAEETPVKILSDIKPDIHVKGSEYKGNIIEKDIIEKNSGKVVFMDRVEAPENSSTTGIIEKILKLYR
jgi:D-glycero-beta-D-manno-heptose 1-phosphate adenylyltransferase